MNESKELGEVVTGGTWIFLSSLTMSFTGFVFWIIVSRVVGVGAVGSTSAAVSAAGVATTIIAAGLPIASLREFAASGIRALRSSLVVTVILGSASAVLAYVLSYRLPESFRIPIWFSSLLAALSVCSSVFTQSLIGMGFFKKYFTTMLSSSVIKLVVAISLAIAGGGLLSPMLGYVAFPMAAILMAMHNIVKVNNSYSGTSYKYLTTPKSFIKLVYSNYPFAFSSQLINMLSIYFFATVTGESVRTGTLYMDLMIMLVIASINGSIISASLSVGVRKALDPFSNALKAGLTLSIPIATVAGIASPLVLWVINPRLVKGAQTLMILTLAVPAIAVTSAAIAKLNKERRLKDIALIGVIRLATLIATLPILMRLGGANGVAVSYLVANTVPLLLAVQEIPDVFKSLAMLWLIQALTYLCRLTTMQYFNLSNMESTLSSVTIFILMLCIYIMRRREEVKWLFSIIRSIFKSLS